MPPTPSPAKPAEKTAFQFIDANPSSSAEAARTTRSLIRSHARTWTWNQTRHGRRGSSSARDEDRTRQSAVVLSAPSSSSRFSPVEDESSSSGGGSDQGNELLFASPEETFLSRESSDTGMSFLGPPVEWLGAGIFDPFSSLPLELPESMMAECNQYCKCRAFPSVLANRIPSL